MNRWLMIFVVLFMFACNNKQVKTGDLPVISTSVLPQKYFIEQIAGDMVKVNVLIPPGASPATYEPTVSQLQDLKNSMVYMRIGYIAFELSWLDKIRSVNSEMTIIDLSEGVELIAEEAHHGDHHTGVDPHIWLSPKNAKIIGKNIFDALVNQMPEKREILEKNYNAFLSKTDSLDKYITGELETLEKRGFFCYHPSLSYYAKEYNLQQYPIELEGKAPSSAHLKYLTDLGKRENIQVIFLQMQFDQHNAKVLAKETGAEIIQINPLDLEWFDQMVYITDRLKSGTNE